MRLPDIKRNQIAKPISASIVAVPCVLIFLLITSACSSMGDLSNAAAGTDKNGDLFIVVDCLLPGQVRQLTSRTRHVTSKRPVKTTGQECSNRGGEFTVFDRADYATALKVWLARAVEGDAESQNYVGEIYEKGLGVPPDYKTAAEWYERAAQQDFSRSYINLANLYEKGLGVERDAVRAMNLYRKASGIDWDELGYSSSLVSSTQLKATITVTKEELGKLRQEQQELQKSLLQTREQRTGKPSNQTADRLASQAAGNDNNPASDADKSAGQRQMAARKNTQIPGLGTDQQTEPDLPPEILIYDPAITLTRGGPTVLLDAQAEFINVVGKISASAGIKEAYINGEQLKTDEFNLFFTILPVTQLPEPVKIYAADHQRNSTEFDFTLQSTSPELVASFGRKTSAGADKGLLGKYHALIIGNSDYSSFPRHLTGTADAVEVKTLLEEKYGFESTLLLNATRYQVLFEIDKLRNQLQSTDNLLIYYAGRCELDNSRKPAYWLPVDAEPQDNSQWISNLAISDLLNTIKSKRIMVVSDSCYAGTFTTAAISRPAVPAGTEGYLRWIDSMKDVRARTVLASGNSENDSNQEFQEQSFFTKTFLEVLRKNERLIDGNSVYIEMLKTMTRSDEPKLAQKAPTYEAIKYAGHEAGEFFFKPVI
jgi:hypothetical protein